MKFSPKTLRIIKTCNLYASCISVGIAFGVIGPCLLDLQEIVHTDTEHIGIIYTGRSAGYLVGSLIGGALFDLTKQKQLLMTVLNFFIAVTMFVVPWSRSVGTLTGCLVLNGFSIGALDTGLSVSCLNLWGQESGPFFQALHFMYGFGSLLAPLIVAPFLSDYHNDPFINDTSSLLNQTSMYLKFNSTNNSTSSEIPSLTYAYIIMGGFTLLVSISFLVIYIIAPSDVDINKSKKAEIRQPGFVFISIVVILTFLLLFVICGTETSYSQMVATTSVKGPLQLTPVVGSYVTSAFWAAFAFSRFASIFLAIKFSSLQLMVFDLVIFFGGVMVSLFLATSKEWALWFSSVLIGFGVASLYASVVNWVERYITITNKILGLFAAGSALGEMAIPYTIAYFLEKVPDILSYTVTAMCMLTIVLTIILHLILRNKQDKYVEKEGISNAAYDANVTG